MTTRGDYCGACVHGKHNTGLIVPRERVKVFCTRLTRIHDEAVVEVLEPLLNQLADEQRCPHQSTGQEFPDSYRAKDRYDSDGS
jgi:hypothetical protein